MSEERARFSREELEQVLSHYDIGRVVYDQDFPRGSHESAKQLIRTDRGRYLLKRLAKGRDDPFRVAFSHELQAYLARKAFPLPHLIGTRRENNSMLKLGNSIYELYEFMPGDGFDPHPAAAFESGKMLALFHKLVHALPSTYEPPIGYYHDARHVRTLMAKLERSLPDMPGAPSAAGEHQAVTECIAALRDAYDHAAQVAREMGLETWDAQIVHCDWHPGNVLYNVHRVVAVLDFDSSRLLPPVTDIANGALQFSLETGGRRPETWPDGCNPDRLASFIRGYEDLLRVSRAELLAVPWLMIEALIAEAVGPIAATGRFARIDGFDFLRIVLRKARWLKESGPALAEQLAAK